MVSWVLVDCMSGLDGWHYVEGTKEDHWVDLYYFEIGSAWTKASVKWDGCIHLSTVANEPYTPGTPANEEQCECYIHICNLDAHIDKLLKLKEEAIKHFGEWPK